MPNPDPKKSGFFVGEILGTISRRKSEAPHNQRILLQFPKNPKFPGFTRNRRLPNTTSTLSIPYPTTNSCSKLSKMEDPQNPRICLFSAKTRAKHRIPMPW